MVVLRPAGIDARNRVRLGWLLRTNRLAGYPDTGLRDFAGMLAPIAGPLSVTSLSRWERGAVLAPYRVVRAYERLLGMPGRSLASVADTVLRYFAPSAAAAPVLARPEPGPEHALRLAGLIDRATTGAIMTDRDWDVLTDRLVWRDTVVVAPTAVWGDLAERLLYEMAVSDGIHWMVRAEAYQRLLAHPPSSAATIATTAAAAADQSMQTMIGTISVLDASAHPDASTHVLRHLSDPLTERTFSGAVLASVRKVGYGHYRQHHLRAVLGVLTDVLRSSPASGVGLHAAMILADLPPAVAAHLPRWVRRDLRGRGHRWTPRRQDLAARVAASAASTRWWPGTGREDEVFAEVVQDALANDLFDERLYAQLFLAQTPYRPALAAALDVELRVARRADATTTTTRLTEALRILGGPAERRHMEELLVAPHVRPSVREAAALALGHMGGSTPRERWRRVLATGLRRWTGTRDPAELAVVDRLVYSLGITGEDPLLAIASAHPATPPRISRAAAWWLHLSPVIRLSVRT